MKSFTKGNVTLLNCDCMEYMANVPDKYFDLAIPDPPYGIGASDYKRGGTQNGKSKAKCKKYKTKQWDNKTPEITFKNLISKVSVNQIIWGGNYYDWLPNNTFKTPRRNEFKTFLEQNPTNWIVWDKDNSDNQYNDCELAYTTLNIKSEIIPYRWHGMLQQNMKEKEIRIHPTQKPVGLYNIIYDKYSNKTMKAIDTHAGSFSSAIAAYYFGFSEFVACEIDEDMFDAGVKRFDEMTNQIKLF